MRQEALHSTALTLAVALVVGVGFAQTGAFQMNEGVQWDGTVHATMYDDQGNVVWEETRENTLTTEGENYFRALAIGEQSDNLNYIALSNASSYAKDKNHGYLEGEVTCCNLTRQETLISKEGDGEWRLKAIWTANGSVEGVKAAGMFPHDVQGTTDNDDNILVAEAVMADKSFRKDYRFSLDWTIQMSSN